MKETVFGNWLKDALKRKEMTQKELAELVGISKSSITMYIRNGVHPNRETLTNILHALGYKEEYVSEEKENG